MSADMHSQTRTLCSLSALQTVCSLSRRKTNVTCGAACFSARVHYTIFRMNRFEFFLTFLFDFCPGKEGRRPIVLLWLLAAVFRHNSIL